MKIRDPEIISVDPDKVQTGLKLERNNRKVGQDTIFSCTLLNQGEKESISFLRPLIHEFELGGSLENVRFFVNGFTSFSGSGSFHLAEREVDTRIPHLRQLHRNFHLPKETKQGHFSSALLGILKLSQRDFITIGFLRCTDYFTQIKTKVYKDRLLLIAQIQLEGKTIPVDTEVNLPDIFVSNDVPWKALSRYTDLLGKEMGVNRLVEVPHGWCSWYHYFTGINETEFLKNLDVASNFKPNLRIFQLDDGYRQKSGDCTKTNNKFPSGLKQLAKQVKDAGLVPGIWVAPFLTHTSDQSTRKNPDWILRNNKNKPVVAMWNPNWGIFRYAYALDISRPDFQNYLVEMFETLYEYDFRFFKLDFLFAACLPGKYYQKDKTSLQILRDGLMLIKDAVKDSLILGCGCPIEAGIGIVDSMRVGNDVTPYWSNFIDRVIGRGFEQLSTKNCIRNTLARSFTHNKLFKNDPDCLITRHTQNRLSDSERFTLGNINALSGGPLMISDDLSSLEPDSMNLLSNVFKLQENLLLNDRVFITPDLMDRTMPHIQVAMGDNDAYIGIYNFSSTPETKTLDVSNFIKWKKYSVIDYYTKESLEIRNNKLTTSIIEKHGAKIYYVHKIN